MKITERLVADWRKAHTWLSVQAFATAAALQGAYLAAPEAVRSAIPSNVLSWVTIAILALGIVGRLTSQTTTSTEATNGTN